MRGFILRRARAVLLLLFAGAWGAHAQSPGPAAELLGLHKQFGLPDCVFEYVVHLKPAIEGIGQLKYRFATKGTKWRIDRLDGRGQISDTWSHDGAKYFVHHRRGNMLIILPSPMEYSREFFAEFTFHPLVNSAIMPFFGSKSDFKIPEVESPTVWLDVLAKNSIRSVEGSPANQAHFALENDEVKGVMKLERGGVDMPPWLVVEQSWSNKSNNATVTMTHHDWRKVVLGDAPPFFLPSKVISKGSGPRYPASETTIELVATSIKKLPDDFPESAFRIPRSAVPNPYDRTVIDTAPKLRSDK